MMEKILILVLLIGSSILNSECVSQNNALVSGNLSTKVFGCACFLGNEPTVPEIYYKNGKYHYERIVVYLYKNKQNNDILMHVPDKIKQKHLPDIIYEKSDFLKTISNEKIVDLYNLPMYSVIYSGYGQFYNKNPYLLENPTAKHNIYDKEITILGKKIIKIQPPIVDQLNISGELIPSDKRREDGKIGKIYISQDPRQNRNKPVSIKKTDDKNHFIPVITKLPTDIIHFPNHVISTTKTSFIKPSHVVRNKTNHKVLNPDKPMTIPPYVNQFTGKLYDANHIPPYHKPISPGHYNFSQNPSYIPSLDNYVQIPFKLPFQGPHDVTDIGVKIPSPKHDHDHKHHTNKPERIKYWETPSNFVRPKATSGHQIQDPYETLIDIIINYPKLVMNPNEKDAKPVSKIEKHKNDKSNEGKIISPIFHDKPSFIDSAQTPKHSTSTLKHNPFDIDSSDIYYVNPAKDIRIPESNLNNNRLRLPIAVTEISQRHKQPGPVYIPERNPNIRDPSNVSGNKPNNDALLCIYCNQNRGNYNYQTDGSLTHIGYKTFNQWFREQMYGFRHNKNYIDVNWVGEYIVKVLHENGLYISKNGMLIDSTGKVQRWQNLKLRAMLVGDSVSLDTVWKLTGSKSSNPEYLAFIILTSIDPPKNLGIIPLGRTILPYSTASLQSLSKKIKPDEVNYYQKLNPKIKADGYIKRSPNEYDISVERFLQTLPNYSKDVNGIFDDVAQSKNRDKNKHNHDYINSEDLFGNDDMLRIIGGSAATGSGTPLSSKGRSIKLDA